MQLLYWDIETAPAIAGVFGIYDQNIPYSHVIQDWFIICAAYRWQHKKKIESVSILDDAKRFKKNPADDYHVVATLHNLISQADVIVAHNGNKFDWKKFMARVVFHGLPPIRKPVMIDTLLQSRQFAFTSRKLDDLGTHLGFANKLETERGLWIKAAQGCAASIRKMVTYCKGDIPPLVSLHERLRPYAGGAYMNMGHFSDAACCPYCGSHDFKRDGYRITRLAKVQRYECVAQGCGRRFTDGKAIKRVVMRPE